MRLLSRNGRFSRASCVRAIAFSAFLAAVVMATGLGTAASSTTVVSADVPSATTLATTGCPALDPSRTSFGVIQPGSGAITSADCNVVFGSSNDTATLRAYQADGRTGAMTAPNTTLSTTGAGTRYLGVDMATASVGWAVGEGSSSTRLMKTTNGGVTWTGVPDASDGLDGPAEGIDTVSSTVAWASRYDSNEVSRTIDGTNWTKITLTAFPTARINKMVAWDANTAWAGGSETVSGSIRARIWRTVDGGANWTLVWSNNSVDSEVHMGVALSATSVFFATTATSNGIVATMDGSTFTPLNPPSPGFRDVDAYDTNNIAAVAEGGYVYTTSNGGTNWTLRTAPVDTSHFAVDYESSGRLLIGSFNGFVARSNNSGSTWTVLDQDADGSKVYALDAVGSTIVTVGHSLNIMSSQDSGVTWNRNSGAGLNWNDVDGVDGGRLWRVGSLGTIQTSTDGGSTWAAQTNPVTKLLNGVVAMSRTSAVAVGADGTIVRTTDSGSTWSAVSSPTSESLHAVTSTSAGRTLYAVGNAGTIIRSDNAGVSWYALTSGVTIPLISVGAWDQNRLMVGASGGGNATLLRGSTDGGGTWSNVTTAGVSDAVVAIAAVPGTTSNRAYVVEVDDVLTTTNAGATWTTQNVPGSGSLHDLDITEDGVGVWGSGAYGHVVGSSDSGASWTSYSGGSTNRSYRGIAALGTDDAVTVGEGNGMKQTLPTVLVPDYDGAAASWTGAGFFGICLRAAPSTTATWPTDGSCDQANGTEWRGLPISGGASTAAAASTLAVGTTTASFRFGMKAPASQAPGTYRAAISFEVTAPSG